MLQQTQVKTVLPYWERWMRELPTIQSVAKASPAKLHKLWEGLGYYTRVRNLQKAARQIIARHAGKFPTQYDDILSLPGIGRYTAGAICSIAFDQPTPILDGNVIRVLARIFGIATDPREKQTNSQLWQLAASLVETAAAQTISARPVARRKLLPFLGEKAGVRANGKTVSKKSCSLLNQSLMELGALICSPRSPDCAACPAQGLCVARKENLQDQLPNLGKRAAATQRRFIAFVVERDGKFLVRQRPDGVVNAHLWEFPTDEFSWTDGCFKLSSTKPLCVIKHSITRYRITLEAWRAELSSPGNKTAGLWLTISQLNKLAFTSAHKKILANLGAGSTASARTEVHY